MWRQRLPRRMNVTKFARVSRRSTLKLAAGAAALPLVHIRTAGAAGKLAVGFHDHWVPRGNELVRSQVDRWAEQNKVDVDVDFITIVGNKEILASAAEDAAGTGHDIMTFPAWEAHNHERKLEPMDDVVGRLEAKYGKLDEYYRYVNRTDGHWIACRPA
jgi:ABC-type glycerol-3-phosphate transport system substrate-binding protein